MTGRLSPEMVAAYLREIGIDYLPVPSRAGKPAPAEKTAALPASVAAGETLEDIRKELLSCRGCPLCAGRRTVVFGVGSPRARLMFVGEGPGEEEDRQGEPFVGAAGRRLNQWIERLGLRRGDVYIANIVKCRPPGNRAPLPEEAASCLPYVKRQIRAIRPEAICTLGAVALQYLLGTAEKITRVRGKWKELEGIPVLPTYHPAFILRNQTRETEVFADLDLLSERLHLK
ncbi:MAG TPA: uracil-DNA glycosylase [Candidatus Limnocylindrales bacterium]|nr:uracil-DNA glycosylase [Candidatus Limnocylindrales bacterium]